ncbi:MAG: DUF1670 domain-containing protein [Planctomycetota bacterium]|jgi:hypothetical protein
MIRQPEREKQARIERKTLEQAAIKQLVNGFSCSPFESRAILDMMQETFEQAWQSPAYLKPGQMMVMAISADEPAGKPLKECQFKPIVVTVHSPEDEHLRHQLTKRRVIPELRRAKLCRIAAEAVAQDAYLTVEDMANRILNCGERTLLQDLQILRAGGQEVPLRGQQQDIGRGISHKVQVIQLALQRKQPSEIARRLKHDIRSVERYLADFTAIARLLAEAWPLEQISFVRRVSLKLVREYQTLYHQARQNGQTVALADLIRDWGQETAKKSHPAPVRRN